MSRNFIREKKIFCSDTYMEVDIYPYTDIERKKGKRSKKKKESEPKQKNILYKRYMLILKKMTCILRLPILTHLFRRISKRGRKTYKTISGDSKEQEKNKDLMS